MRKSLTYEVTIAKLKQLRNLRDIRNKWLRPLGHLRSYHGLEYLACHTVYPQEPGNTLQHQQ